MAHAKHHGNHSPIATFLGGVFLILFALVAWRVTANTYNALNESRGAWFGVTSLILAGVAFAGLLRILQGGLAILAVGVVIFAALIVTAQVTKNQTFNPMTWGDKITPPVTKFAEWMRTEGKTDVQALRAPNLKSTNAASQ